MANRSGICRNQTCEDAKNGVLFDWYEGPGEYCPQCGETLEVVDGAPPVTAAAAPAERPSPFGGLSASEALKQFQAQEVPPAAAPAPPPRKRRRIGRLAFGAMAIVVASVAAIVEFHPTAVGHPGVGGEAVRVCRTSMTERFAGDLVRAYAQKSGVPTSRFEFARSSPCEVRIAISGDANSAEAVGHDAIVAVVNPSNGISRLSADQVRRIYSGEITDWSAIGGVHGRIVAVLPEEGSDEAATLASGLLRGVRIASGVTRMAASADVARTVVRADHRTAIGLVAFGEAVPARVLTLGSSAPPNPLSIAEHRYPISLSITVGVDGSARDSATSLVQYARSDEAQAIVLRSGLVSKKGL